MNRNGQRRAIPPEGPVAVWQASYGSLAMILVVFFVMLVSYSQISGRSALQIRAALGGKADGIAGTEGSGVPAAPALAGEDNSAAGAKALAEAGGVLRGALESANLSRGAVLEKTRPGWRMVLGMNTLFAGETIRESMHPFLREIGNAATRGNLAVCVEVPGVSGAETGGARPSWAEPALRAAGVIDFLERSGVRTPLSIRAGGASPSAAGSPAETRGEFIISLSIPGVEH